MLVLVFGPSEQSQFWEFPEIQALVYCVPTHRRATKKSEEFRSHEVTCGFSIQITKLFVRHDGVSNRLVELHLVSVGSPVLVRGEF